MITLTKVRDLNLAGTRESRPGFVYSASGLVELDNEYVVLADDEFHLAFLPKDTAKAGRWVRLLTGDLPLDYKLRKKQKADLESLTLLSPTQYGEHGALLVVPSMSRANRILGAVVPLSDAGGVAEPVPVDFSLLHEALAPLIEELNIEGVVVTPQSLKLFHRGSKGNSKNAVIDLDIKHFFSDLQDTHIPSAKYVTGIREYDLGQLTGVKLGFTDATRLKDGNIIFLAAAEDTKNAYDDGKTVGSAIGLMNKAGDIVCTETVEGRHKLEGVSAHVNKGSIELKLVCDTDNAELPSSLFAASWAPPWD